VRHRKGVNKSDELPAVAADVLADREPMTPAWLPVLGLAIFVTAAIGFFGWTGGEKATADDAAASASAPPAAPPAPTPTPVLPTPAAQPAAAPGCGAR
jgi:hypothetical protein